MTTQSCRSHVNSPENQLATNILLFSYDEVYYLLKKSVRCIEDGLISRIEMNIQCCAIQIETAVNAILGGHIDLVHHLALSVPRVSKVDTPPEGMQMFSPISLF